MKAFVITIDGMEESVRSANRCIKSGQKYGVSIERSHAFTPKHDPRSIAKELGIETKGFIEKYSRFENCLSAFLSHQNLWHWAVKNNEDVLILEHDAVFTDFLPEVLNFKGVLSLGAPSYGNFIKPKTLGVNTLVSKQYLPGAHAYIVNPNAAKTLINKSKEHAQPTDIFLSNRNFDFMEEYYPWPVEARDSFSTIQRVEGCGAKHNYGETYRLL